MNFLTSNTLFSPVILQKVAQSILIQRHFTTISTKRFILMKKMSSYLQEQFKLWSYQYFWDGAKEWSADRVNQLQILKDVAFKIIDFISQFEDELVKIWNKPKFVKNSNYVITLDRIIKNIPKNSPSMKLAMPGDNSCSKTSRDGILKNSPSVNLAMPGDNSCSKTSQDGIIKNSPSVNLAMPGDNSCSKTSQDGILKNSPSVKGWQPQADGVVKWNELPFNPNLKEKAKELRKAGNLSEVLIWNQIKNKQFLGLDFDRQKIIGNYIVDFYCKNLGVVIEIDGVSHDGKIEYDLERDAYLKKLGLKVIHISDLDVKKNLEGVLEYLKNELNTPSANADTPLQEGNLLERILNHPNIYTQIKEWQELGIVDNDFKVSDIFENSPSVKGWQAKPDEVVLNPKYKHLPIDTKYFKDLELEILSLFDDGSTSLTTGLDKSLDGWLIKSENYQALNTILPKFKEKVQTIYIDPPFNLDSSDQFMYRTNYKDANWATLLENRLRIAKEWLNEKGSIFVRCDYNGNWIVRPLLNEIFGEENFRNEIIVARGASKAGLFTQFDGIKSLAISYDNFYWYSKKENLRFTPFVKEATKEQKTKGVWTGFDKGEAYDRPTMRYEILGVLIDKGQWKWSKERSYKAVDNYKKYLYEFSNKMSLEEYWDKTGRVLEFIRKNENGRIQYWVEPRDFVYIDNNWLDITGYSSTTGFQTENSEYPLKRIIETFSSKDDLVMDFFLGSGTTIAVAHKLGRKWIGVEMGEHFYSVVLPRMKKVFAYDKSGITKELKTPCQTSSDTPLKEGNYYEGGGFFKYYELEQYEETLANCKYEDGDLFSSPLIKGWTAEGRTGYWSDRSPYQEYVFLKDEKMLKALEIDYENNKVKVDLSKLYPNIDIAETLSNLTGKWIKKISDSEVEFEDGTKINTKDLDYKLIKPLIWWE